MSRAVVLARGRRAAERGMVDTCEITRSGGRTTDPDTGAVTSTPSVIYGGKCRFQQPTAQSQREDVGEDHLLLLRFEVQLPMSATGFKVGDAIRVVASMNDPDLPGRVFLIHDLAHKTEATSRRVQVVEKTGS